jgi:hypothetical protein
MPMTTPNQPNGATATADRSVELVNHLLKLPEEVKRDLANLLLDSVREGFTSLEEVEKRDKELIRTRIEAYERGDLKATDWREALDRVERQFRMEFPQ